MGIIAKIKGWLDMLFKNKAKEEFDIEDVTSEEMKQMIERCADIYRGKPYWIDPDEHIKTINFAKSVCSETARLVTLGIGIQIEGSSRANWLQEQIEGIYFQLRNWVEYGCAFGTIILKPNGESIDLYKPDDFIITDQNNGEVTGCVFISREIDNTGSKFYTRLEYHRFLDNGLYAISNKCYVGSSENDISREIAIEKTPWAGLLDEAVIENIAQPLFGVLRTPQANNIDIDSPLSPPIFADAIEEFKDLDIAYSRNAKEIRDSKRIVLLDSDRLLPTGNKVRNTLAGFEKARKDIGLPDYVKNVYGDGQNNFYEEINPTLNTDTRLTGINALLSQIGYKCGFSNGYFVFNESTGIQTATGVEAEQQRTVQFIKDCRDKLENCLDDLIYALNVFADLYGYAPAGKYEVQYDFGDILYNYEEDKARWYSYATQGKVPFWYYLTKFENMTEEDAKALEAAAQPKEPTLFGREE